MLTKLMKDSNSQWVGEIPKTWNKNKLKNYFYFSKGKNSSIYTKSYVSEKGDYPVYSGQTESEGILGYISNYEYDLKECIFTTTVGANVMTVKILKGKFSLSQNCLIMQKKIDCSLEYFYYLLQSLF